MARIRILAIKEKDKWVNLLTTIIEKHNSINKSSFKPVKKITGEDMHLVILEGFISNDKIADFKSNILNSNFFIDKNYKITFNIEKTERVSFLLPKEDLTARDKKQLLSPFKSNANLFENWCIDDEIKNIWINISREKQIEISKNLEINLYEMIDRAGNILHFKEINEIDVAIIHQNDTFITFSTMMNGEFVPNKYFANLEIKSYDDVIFKKGFIIRERFIDFELQDEDYNISVEIYNLDNDECVYKNTFIFMKELSLNMQIAGPKIVFRDQQGNEIHSIQTYSGDTPSSVVSNKHSKQIQYQLMRNNWTRKLQRKKSLDFRGFKGNENPKALKYFNELLKRIANDKQDCIYIADPYFLSAEFDIRRFVNYMDIFAAVRNKEVRILTCNNQLPKSLKHFIKNNSNHLFKNVKIKSVIELSKKENKEIASFHDRWIASDSDEYGFTNSLNNFKKGVSFFKSSEHYYEEAKFLWDIKHDNPQYKIEEFKLYED